MHTDRITRGFGGVLVLLGFWQLSVQLFAGFTLEIISSGVFVPVAYLLTGVCLLLNRSKPFLVRSMAVLEAVWAVLSLWLGISLLRNPAASTVSGIPGFFNRILWLYYFIAALRFAVLALIGFYVPHAKRGALVGMIFYGVLALSQLFHPSAFALYLGYALLFRRLRREEEAQGTPLFRAHREPEEDIIEAHGEVVQDKQDYLKG